MEFYIKLRKEYEKASKPFTYEFSLNSEQPKHKKFRIILNKFVEILKDGMKEQYRCEDLSSSNYWEELEKKLGDTLQISFISKTIYEAPDKKMRIYLALLLHNRKIFETFNQIFTKLPYLFENSMAKRAKFEEDIEPINFLKNGQVIVDSNYIKEFQRFREGVVLQNLNLKKDIESLLAEMVDIIQKGILQEQAMKKKRQNARIEEEKRKQEQQEQKRTNFISKPLPPVKSNLPAKPIQQKVIKPYPAYTPYPEQVQIKRKPRHLKNSQNLFSQRFKDEIEVFHFSPKPEQSQNKKVCYECKRQLSQGFYIFGANMNYCNYTGQWFCNEHISQERIQIPFKAKEEFDLKGYYVSKRSFYEIKSFFDKAIIEIKYDDKVVRQHKKLYDFLVLKRQIHLMYDSICNSELMDKMLGNSVNYCLKENYFSLKNLYDIYNGHQNPLLESQFAILTKHFYKCEICQSKKGRICVICNYPPKIFAFELRQTYSCEHCHKISHRRCLIGNKCPCQM